MWNHHGVEGEARDIKLFETFSLTFFFLHVRFLEELALLKIYRKVTAGESIDGDSSVEENEEGTSDDDIENWTDVDSDGESEDDSTGSYEDVTIKVLYMGDKKVINMYRENSDMYKATLSERGLECLQASGHDVDLDKVRKNTYMIINKMTSEGLEEIKKAKKPKKKATYIHMDSKKGVLTMLIHMKLL